MVTFHTNHGDIVINTFADKAPVTVENFLNYCRKGFYDNTIFHRVINGFMIQGGGFEPGMSQKTTDAPIKNEANNGLKNTRGTLSMALRHHCQPVRQIAEIALDLEPTGQAHRPADAVLPPTR